MKQPNHQVTVGRMRLSLFGKRGDDIRNVMIERTHTEAGTGWYPAASFRVQDLPLLGQAVEQMQQHLAGVDPKQSKPSTKAASQATAPGPRTPGAARNGAAKHVRRQLVKAKGR